MKKCVQTAVVFLVMELLTGEEVRTIEAAKQLIAHADQVDPELLTRIVRDPGYRRWSKMMAAYVLGFLPATETSEHPAVLRATLADKAATVALRNHAAESLGNLRDDAATPLLEERLLDTREANSVRKGCLYALQELGSSSALRAIRSFAETHPRGVLGEELLSVQSR